MSNACRIVKLGLQMLGVLAALGVVLVDNNTLFTDERILAINVSGSIYLWKPPHSQANQLPTLVSLLTLRNSF